MLFLTSMELTGILVASGTLSSSHTTPGELVSPELYHNAVVRPKECTVAILHREIARIKERDYWEDGIEVGCLRTSTLFLLTSP
jgi:hypothetical protein